MLNVLNRESNSYHSFSLSVSQLHVLSDFMELNVSPSLRTEIVRAKESKLQSLKFSSIFLILFFSAPTSCLGPALGSQLIPELFTLLLNFCCCEQNWCPEPRPKIG